VILFIITVILFLTTRLHVVAITSVSDEPYLCALRATEMFEVPSSVSSSDDGGEDSLVFEELLDEASLAVQGAANECSCGGHQTMMAAFGLIESGRLVDAAESIVSALGSCTCDESRGFLRDALDVVAQLGREDSPDEEEQLLRWWTAGVQLTTACGEPAPAKCTGAGALVGKPFCGCI
jgi:hypothetical protein